MVNVADWIPMGPLQGPPLPRFLDIYWPWIKGELPPEEQPPEEQPPEQPPLEAFTFGAASAQMVTYESSPAWNTVIFSCSIKNPNDQTKSENVRFMMEDRKYYYSDNGDPYIHTEPQIDNRQVAVLNLTLGPNENRNFQWNGNAINPATNVSYGPLLGRPHDYCFYMKGEANESQKSCVSNR